DPAIGPFPDVPNSSPTRGPSSASLVEFPVNPLSRRSSRHAATTRGPECWGSAGCFGCPCRLDEPGCSGSSHPIADHSGTDHLSSLFPLLTSEPAIEPWEITVREYRK